MSAPDAATPGDTRSPEDIEHDLARTREELGDTVEALTDHLDVRGRARQWAAQTRQRARDRAGELSGTRGRELAGGAAVLVALVVVAVWGARRR